jgi:PhzF family phenazine biosynthesis protein
MTEVYIARAFTRDPEQGNPAGVVINHDLTTEEMQAIATKLAYAETAFVQTQANGNYKSRFFTPQSEIDFCGHATIAAAQVMRDYGTILSYNYAASRFVQLSATHETIIDYHPKQPIMMHQSAAIFDSIDRQPRRMAEMLGLSIRDLGRLPIQTVSTMARVALVQVKSLEALKQIDPDLEAIKQYTTARKLGGGGLYAFTYNSNGIGEADFLARSFDPEVGIDEDGATGVAAGALAGYISSYSPAGPKEYIISQGFDMGQESTIYTKVSPGTVKVGGYAVNLGVQIIEDV